MATYRVFLLGNDNHIIGVDVIDCPSDDEAMTRVPSLAGAHQAVEVWEFGRRVGRVDPERHVGAE